jgi:protein-tyrosine phosphatase
VIAVDRIIEFERLLNVRDLGGLRAEDGRTVRSGLLYRADALSKLNDAGAEDLQRFAKLGLRTVIDLRYPWEIERNGMVPGAGAVDWHNLSIEHRPYDQSMDKPGQPSERFFADRYAETAFDGKVEIRAALEVIADADSAPLVFHCKSGKDRTGIIAALILTLMGVPEAEIVADYTLTEQARPRFLAEWEAQHRAGTASPLRTHAFRAPARAMELFLLELARDYGSVLDYIAATGADVATLGLALRERYLD